MIDYNTLIIEETIAKSMKFYDYQICTTFLYYSSYVAKCVVTYQLLHNAYCYA